MPQPKKKTGKRTLESTPAAAPASPEPFPPRPVGAPTAGAPCDVAAVLMNTGTADKLRASEYEVLKGVLEILRQPGPMGFQSLRQNVLSQLIMSRSEDETAALHDITGAITEYFTNIGNEECLGFIAGGQELVFLDEESHLRALSGVASLLKSDTWLGDWIQLLAAHSKKRNLTPLDVSRTLVDEIDNFEGDVRTAKRTRALYPKLFEASGSQEAQA